MQSSTAAKMRGMEKLMFSVGSKMFLSSKAALGWSETLPCARNGFGHFSSVFALSPAPSTSLAVTMQSPVPGGDEPQGPPLLAQLGVENLCATSHSRVSALSPFTGACPGGPAYKAAAVKPPSLKFGI